MACFPYTHLVIHSKLTIASAGPHILVLDTPTGKILSSTQSEKHDVLKSGPVRCLDINSEMSHIVTVAEDKILKVWHVAEDALKLLNQRDLPKKPTKVRFTRDGQTILVSDKFGDVFGYPLHYTPAPQDADKQKQKKDALSSHENPSDGTLILGHASPLNSFVLTKDEKYIITADRDEHVRVSRFPKGYIIEMYCLGHKKFVSALHIPTCEPLSLISGGGDADLKIWECMKGTVRWELKIWDVVERFLIVKAVKRSGWGDDGEGEGEGEGEERVQRKEGKRTRGKKKGRAEDVDVDDNEDEEKGIADTPVEDDTTKPSKVLVVQQIESVISNSHLYILFSAVGSTALFAFPFKSDVQPSEIVHFDFRKPVLGFSVVPEEDGVIIVTLDREWNAADSETDAGPEAVRVMGISSGQLTEYSEYKRELMESLNARTLVPATPSELKQLDLYGALSSLPKYSSDTEVEGTSKPRLLPIGAPEQSVSNYKAKAKAKGKCATEGSDDLELSKKEVGRIKGKMKVLEKARAQAEEKTSEKLKKELVRKRDGKGGEEMQEEKDVKRPRVEDPGLGDVIMDES